MDNPWNHIPLEAYEAHMSQASVGQLQTLDRMMDGQFRRTPARTAVIFGVAGGKDKAVLFRKGEVYKTVPFTEVAAELKKQIEESV